MSNVANEILMFEAAAIRNYLNAKERYKESIFSEDCSEREINKRERDYLFAKMILDSIKS